MKAGDVELWKGGNCRRGFFSFPNWPCYIPQVSCSGRSSYLWHHDIIHDFKCIPTINLYSQNIIIMVLKCTGCDKEFKNSRALNRHWSTCTKHQTILNTLSNAQLVKCPADTDLTSGLPKQARQPLQDVSNILQCIYTLIMKILDRSIGNLISWWWSTPSSVFRGKSVLFQFLKLFNPYFENSLNFPSLLCLRRHQR